MKLWLVIPVKPLHEAKSRLHNVLSDDARAHLSRSLLTHVLDIAHDFAAGDEATVAGIVVISRDRDVLAEAAARGAVPLAEHGCDLNDALNEARRYAVKRGADALLALPSDLPLLTVADLQQLCADPHAAVVIAPSRDGGTNALLLHPADAIDFAFGPESFRRHCQRAQTRGLRCRVVESTTLAFDIDWPCDLNELAILQG